MISQRDLLSVSPFKLDQCIPRTRAFFFFLNDKSLFLQISPENTRHKLEKSKMAN